MPPIPCPTQPNSRLAIWPSLSESRKDVDIIDWLYCTTIPYFDPHVGHGPAVRAGRMAKRDTYLAQAAPAAKGM